MHVAIANLTNGGLSGGYRSYLLSLVPQLRREPRIRRLEVFVPPATLPALEKAGLDGLSAWPPGDHRRGFAALRHRLQDLGPDVLFVPSARFIDVGRPCVTMVRNMEPLECPLAGHTLRAGFVNLARAWEAHRACRQARRVLAVSGHVSRFLTTRWRLSPAKVGVVYHGVEGPLPEATRPAALRALGDRPFLFTAGSIRPARGLEDLLEAIARSAAALSIVIAGAADPDTEAFSRRLEARAVELGVADRVIWTGWLGRSEMSWCFSHCQAFVMTSRAEACPNTVLEALSHGCLSISTDQPPMPEIGGAGAIYYRRRDAGDLARRIAEGLSLPSSEREERRHRARQRAAAFTWAATARQTIDELSRVLE